MTGGNNINRSFGSDEMTNVQDDIWRNDTSFNYTNSAHGLPFFNESTAATLVDGLFTNADPCNVSPPFFYEDYTQLPAVRHTFIVLYALVAFLAAIGNTMVIWTIFRNKHMRTVTNYYIMNLAVSDFLVATFVMPLKLLEYTAPCTWHMFTNTLCSVLYYVLPVFVFTSVLTLVAIALERYYAVVHPFVAMKMHGKSRTRKILAATWIIPIVVAAPYLYCTSLAFTIESPMGLVSRQICNDRFDEIDEAIQGSDTATQGTFRKAFFFFLFVAIYLLPMVIILVTCIRIIHTLLQPIVENNGPSGDTRNFSRRREENKRKVARMVIVVAASFILAWTPFYLASVISQLQKHSFLKSSNFLFTMLITHLFGFVNSGVNPLIYYLMSERFRRSFTTILDNVFCCLCRLLGIRSSEHPSADWFSAIEESVDSSNHTNTRHIVVKLSGLKNDNVTPENGHAYYHK